MNQTSTSSSAKERYRNPSRGPAAKMNPFPPKTDKGAARMRRRRPAARVSELQRSRETLLELRDRLRGNVARADDSLGSSVTESSAAPDSVDYAAEAVEQDVAVGLLGSATETLGQIDGALERIESGTYGRCAECDTPIPAARLEAIPYATCCVQCAAMQEQDREPPSSSNHSARVQDTFAAVDEADEDSAPSGPSEDDGNHITREFRRYR